MEDVTNFEEVANGYTVRAAARNGRIEIVKYMAKKFDQDRFEKLLFEKRYQGWTMFHDVAGEGHLEMLKYLCEKTSRRSYQKDIYGRTPIDVAKRNGHLEIVKYLASLSPKPSK